MTCEVAVANKNGLALAADSAVSLGDQRKVFHSADKLFQLSKTEPLAVMTYGSAEIMGVPWEVVIKMYAKRLGARSFDHVTQYAEDFLRFLESSNPLFPEDVQRREFKKVVQPYMAALLHGVWEDHGHDATDWSKSAWDQCAKLFSDDEQIWSRYESLGALGPGGGNSIVAHYNKEIEESEQWLFGNSEPPREIREAVRRTVRMMHEKQWISPLQDAGIVIAGFGEGEVFPHLEHFHVGGIVAGKLRYMPREQIAINHDTDSFVTPFAQRQIIDMFYDGIHPMAQKVVLGVLREIVEEIVPQETAESQGSVVDELCDRFRDRVTGALYDHHVAPLIRAVAALPLTELASLAEALVSLTAFRVRMAADEAETVAGDIDVAVLSKGDGFVWVRRKELLGRTRVERTQDTRF